MSPTAKRPALPPEASYALANGARILGNAARMRREAPEWVSLTIGGGLPELAPPRNPIQQRLLPPVLSQRGLELRIDRVAEDPRIRGLVLHLRPLALSQAQLQGLRAALERLRAAGKRLVAWSHTYDTGAYYLASVADEVLIQPGGGLRPMGVQGSFAFLADTLERAGLRFDLLQISPYKTAGDSLTRRELSPAAREMADWLLDEAYAELLAAICRGRGIDLPAAEAIVDASPCTDRQALELAAVDAICSEEDLPARLGEPGAPARIADWSKAERGLLLPRPGRGGRRIALIRIEGMIVDGKSEHPPVDPPLPLAGGPRAGDLSVVQQARAALDDEQVAAALVYISSPGGSATASEAMAAALGRLAERKPVVVVMGSVAASGGYYVATPAHWILARPGTITGSIGVLSGKLVNAGLLDRLSIHREQLKRGANIDFESGEAPFSPEQRQKAWASVERIYEVFLARVAAARGLEPAELEPLAGGRVWTGRQALEHGLIDGLGGLEEGLAKARELAGLHPRAPLRMQPAPKPLLAPQALSPAAGLRYLLEGLAVLDGRPLCLCPWLGLDRALVEPTSLARPWAGIG